MKKNLEIVSNPNPPKNSVQEMRLDKAKAWLATQAAEQKRLHALEKIVIRGELAKAALIMKIDASPKDTIQKTTVNKRAKSKDKKKKNM
jgi:hypothetical protein